MKKILSILLSASVIISCTSCSDESTEIGNDTSNGSLSSDNTQTSEEEAEPDNINHDNPRVDYTKEEVAEIINSMPNFKVSDDGIYVRVPKEIDHVSEFYASDPQQPNPEESLEEFLKVFEYLFPEHEMDKDSLYYYYWTDDEDEYYWDMVDNPGEASIFETSVHKLYDEYNYNIFLNELAEKWQIGHYGCYFYYTEKKNPKENSVSATLRMPFGSDLCIFNKGLGQRIGENIGEGETYYAYEHAVMDEYFEFVGGYAPDSEEVFKLYDKEISIKDAAEFFESYVSGIPTSAKQFYKIHVNSVYVYKMNEETYCYFFITSKQYDGIHFDYYGDGTQRPADSRDLGYGCMVRSDDVDYIYGSYRACTVKEETVHTEIIPFEEAVKTASEKLTQHVEFQVYRAELLYCAKENIGEYWLGQTKYPVYPAWKLTLINPNDDLVYTAYVNALTGEFRSYHQ